MASQSKNFRKAKHKTIDFNASQGRLQAVKVAVTFQLNTIGST